MYCANICQTKFGGNTKLLFILKISILKNYKLFPTLISKIEKKMKIALFVQNKFFWFKERFACDQIAILMMQTKISIKQCLKNFISKNKYISSLCIMQSWAKGKKIAFKTLWRYPVSSWFLLRQIILAEKLIRWYWGMKNHIHHTALNSLINIAKRKQPIMSEAW